MGRFGTADEVASIAVLLATNGFMTGQTVHPNGGLYFTS
jgi:3-oxoacyl-[acyl-carrier protein] reductase